MYLLDTNICIAIIQGNPSAIAHFQQKYQDCYLVTLVLGFYPDKHPRIV
ncbi:hypothetical protein [Coleofasciculus chthonoplastes]